MGEVAPSSSLESIVCARGWAQLLGQSLFAVHAGPQLMCVRSLLVWVETRRTLEQDEV